MADDQEKRNKELALDRKQLQEQREAAVDAAFQNPDNVIIPVDLEDEMKKSFIDYAMSVISDRALPDIRDGLKPVHRRIIYSMFTLGFTPDKPYRKCATTVGDVLGRFHPHGDAAVYDSLVRMAQDFSMRHTLIDGHGNFGSRDGDPPAAYRYTEARLTKLAVEMMQSINKDTVDFQPNYDEHTMEPTVLPASFPNLLVNGSTGIAVGMATNIPPHNLGEIIDGAVMLLDNPSATVDDLMSVVQAPDFPTGGMICGLSGVRQTYRTGRGRIVVRAHTTIEAMRGSRYRIIVHDLPYMVNKARLIERIADLVKDKRLDGISDVRDESDRHEDVRIVIELRRDATPEVVLNQLYKNTQMQDAFNANMLALVIDENGKYAPKVVTLVEALTHYLDHDRDVVRRRTTFDLEKAEARRHLVEGLQLAIDHIDEVINIIRASQNEDIAKKNLSARFAFTEKQAQHVVDMRLGRLSGLERDKLQAEYEDLCRKIEAFRQILDRPELLDGVIRDELLEIKRRYADARRTEIVMGLDDEIDDESLIEEEQVMITMTHYGYVKRMPVDVYNVQRRGGRGITAMQTRDEDFVKTIVTTSTHDILLFFTTKGRVFQLKGYQIPEASRQARGMAIVNLLRLDEDEQVYGMIPIQSFDDGGSLTMATRCGLIKKTPLADYRNIHAGGLIAIRLREDDEVIGVTLTDEEDDILIGTRNGLSIRFPQSDVRETGRNTMGVKAITLTGDDEVVGMSLVKPEMSLLVVTENGFGKRTEFSEYRVQNRGGKGILTYRVTSKTGKIVGLGLADDSMDIMIINDLGIVIRIPMADIPILSRVTQGVTLMRSREGQVVSAAIVEHEESDDEVEANANMSDGDVVKE